jgi:hypothetical protein
MAGRKGDILHFEINAARSCPDEFPVIFLEK